MLVARYGLVAVLLGAGLEGEAVVLTAGVLVHKGLLPFWGVAACAAAGSCVVDQLWFLVGRLAKARPWVQRLRGRPAYGRALRLLRRHAVPFIFSFRFIYGLRTVSPVVIGTSDVPARMFVVLNLLAAAIWGPLLTWVGYEFGRAIDPLLRDARTAAMVLVYVAAAAGLGLATWRIVQARRRRVEAR